MSRQRIPFNNAMVRFDHLWARQWMLLTSGDFEAGDYNTMTVGWGSLGRMWEKPFVQVVVRPVRYTYTFMERFETFTLTAFPRPYQEALRLLGTRSGRDGDKIAAAGLTPERATRVASPTFAEAELSIECRKIYSQDLDPSRFLAADIESHYPEKDYHRIYFGEILAIEGAARFASNERGG